MTTIDTSGATVPTTDTQLAQAPHLNPNIRLSPETQQYFDDQAAVGEAERVFKHVSDNHQYVGYPTEGNLRFVAQTMINLTPDQTQQLMERLSNQDLQNFGRAMFTGDVPGLTNNGLNASDRQTLYSHLAQDLPGEQMARLGIGFGDMDNVANAVSVYSPASERVQFIKTLAPSASAGEVPTFGGSTFGNGSARAIVNVLGTLQGQSAEYAFGSMTRAQLDTVMEVAQGRTLSSDLGSGNPPYTTFDASGLQDILNAASTIPDTNSGSEQKARIFDVAADQLSEVRGIPFSDPSLATGQILNGMTTLLRSDPSGIITELRDSADENTGNAMTAYVRTMFVSGRDSQIGNIMGQLKAADGGDVTASFNNPTDNHNNARNLGYFTGAISKGLAEISSDRGNLTNNLVAVAGGVATVFGMRGPFEGVIGVAVDKGSSILGGSNLGSFSSRQDAIADSFRVLAWPVPEVPDSGSARTQMQDAVNAFNAERNNVR